MTGFHSKAENAGPTHSVDCISIYTFSNKIKIAYVMFRLPKHTETAILYEMLAFERAGCICCSLPDINAARRRRTSGGTEPCQAVARHAIYFVTDNFQQYRSYKT